MFNPKARTLLFAGDTVRARDPGAGPRPCGRAAHPGLRPRGRRRHPDLRQEHYLRLQPDPGIYCVDIDRSVNLNDEPIIQAASPTPHSDCGNRADTVTVWVKWALVHGHELSPGNFYLSIPQSTQYGMGPSAV
ncbi:hypothetical protein SAMN05444920_13161 [Nonomuraea solani]|uniref:Uncharacterized protein n=1 Tax=Nonomuraea solani TaxID=1144553 RepID=A0A1H6F184_9ACTN|nr:hypothetical protein SAMN05444920_13161 [Nonomuraea solani]